jgi:hypothetical protein
MHSIQLTKLLIMANIEDPVRIISQIKEIQAEDLVLKNLS